MHHITSQAHVEHICAPENVCTHKADHKRCTVSSSVFYASSSKIYFHCSLSIPHFCTQIAPCMFKNSLFFYFSPCFKQQVKFCLLYMDIIEICQLSHFSLCNAIHSHYSLLRQFYHRRQRGQKTYTMDSLNPGPEPAHLWRNSYSSAVGFNSCTLQNVCIQIFKNDLFCADVLKQSLSYHLVYK